MKSRHPEKENKPINPIKKKPDWIRSKLTNSKEFFLTKTIVNNNNLVTVCQEANCPNITECWSKRHATFMIMGDTCTRACAFCDVITGKPKSLDTLEPFKIASAVKKLNLKHSVITSVDRDDLNDGGANHLGAAMGCTVITIITGVMYPGTIEPWNNEHLTVRHPVSCSPCYEVRFCPEGHRRCIVDISVEMVLSKVRMVLGH